MRKLWASLSLLARSRATLTARTPTQVALLVARPELRPPRARMHITIPSARGPQRWSSRRARIPSPSPRPHSLPATGGQRDSARARRIARLTMADVRALSSSLRARAGLLIAPFVSACRPRRYPTLALRDTPGKTADGLRCVLACCSRGGSPAPGPGVFVRLCAGRVRCLRCFRCCASAARHWPARDDRSVQNDPLVAAARVDKCCPLGPAVHSMSSARHAMYIVDVL
ncbi:hypothetical protein BD413DRAFT_551835 [Trametes elegans]|nr:hypothetical protein BD413DRAFT_551835 [Trametes elegans]